MKGSSLSAHVLIERRPTLAAQDVGVLFGFKPELTLRQRLRRRVNELISRVNFTGARMKRSAFYGRDPCSAKLWKRLLLVDSRPSARAHESFCFALLHSRDCL